MTPSPAPQLAETTAPAPQGRAAQAPRAELRLNAPVLSTRKRLGRLRGIVVLSTERRVSEIAVNTGLRRQRLSLDEIVEADEDGIHIADSSQSRTSAHDFRQGLELRSATSILDVHSNRLGYLDLVSYVPRMGAIKGVVARRGIVLRRRRLVPVELVSQLSEPSIRTEVSSWDAIPRYASDGQLEHDIHAALRRDVQLGTLALGGHALTMEPETITIEVHHQWAALKGTVPSRGLAGRATEIAAAVPGVRGVDAFLVADDDLEIAVAGRLAQDERTRPERIGVSVRGGWASLNGTVQSADRERLALAIAQDVHGLRGVRSALQVASARATQQ